MTLTLQKSRDSQGVTGVTKIGSPNQLLAAARRGSDCSFLRPSSARAHSSHHLLVSQMARGKGKTKQSSLQTAGLLPTLKKPREAIGCNLHVPGEFWVGCAAADKKKIYVCTTHSGMWI